MGLLIDASYLVAAVLFIVGLQQMSSPVTARRGIVWAGLGMLLATLVTFGTPELLANDHLATNLALIFAGIGIGGGYAWISGRRVAMTDMPQMIAMYNGMGGGAAATIAAVELLKAYGEAGPGETVSGPLGVDVAVLAILGAIIGTVSFSGSIIAWAKLDGRLHLSRLLPGQHFVNAALAVATVVFAVLVFLSADWTTIAIFYALALLLGIFITIPVGGADMPVIISLFNALTGLAVGFEGYVLGNAAMIIAGIVVGSAGSLLTHLMAVAMNRSVANVFFAGVGTGPAAAATGEQEMKEIQAQDAGILLAFASQAIIIPGYGMAVAQAQHRIWELAQLLIARGVKVKFAIHPVAGRMPGHMNVLLAEENISYEKMIEMERINPTLHNADVVIIIGANDVVNPAARNADAGPLSGMPIINADQARSVIVIKRSLSPGFAGVHNPLFIDEKTLMLFDDGKRAIEAITNAYKEM